jgi:hypothetical protein
MDRTINRLKLIFLGIFAVLAAAMLVWQIGWVFPMKKCEVEQHKWWDSSQRVCAQPILTSDITGRVIVDKAAREEALRAIGRLPPAKPANGSAPAPK